MSDIVTERSESILRVQLNRPSKKNALTSSMYVTLAEILNEAAGDDAIRVVLWHGAGGSFSAGNDVEDFLKNPPGPGQSPQSQLMTALMNLDKPLVAAVQGIAVGGGTTMLTHCDFVYAGESNLCSTLQQTIIGRHGAFATHVRCHWIWATPLPEGIDAAKAGPLFCGGITVFNPLVQFDVKPTDRVAVVGIGGLGHMALQFLNKWGCHVTAFSTSDNKAAEAQKLGAHAVVNTRSEADLKKVAGSLNLILSTVTANLDMNLYLSALTRRGRFHSVGVIPEIRTSAAALLFGQLQISSSPPGAPVNVIKMLDFAARHGVAPITEEFPMSQANEALAHLESGKARYRVVLKNDL